MPYVVSNTALSRVDTCFGRDVARRVSTCVYALQLAEDKAISGHLQKLRGYPKSVLTDI